LPPLTGAATVGQLQFGAVTARVLLQEVVAVKIMFVPAGIPNTDQLFPLVFTTVPDVLVNVPALKLTLIDQVERSIEQTGELAIEIAGKGFTVMVIVAVVAHNPAVGVKVYAVVLALFKAGAHVPVMPLFEVVGKAERLPPAQIAAT
jgi:hypothetical protein